MRSGAALVAAGSAALAVVLAAGTVANRRQRELELSPLPTVESGAPRGLAAARAWLVATGRPHRVLHPGDEGPAPGEVLLLVAPPAPLDARAAAALLDHADRGGLVVWAMGQSGQPALEGRLGVVRVTGESDLAPHEVTSASPHPLFDGLALQTGGATLRAIGQGALPAATEGERTVAAAVPLGAGEAIVLAGPSPLENFRLGDGENLSLLSRLAGAGPLVFDERHLAGAGAASSPSRHAAALLATQGLLAAAVLLLSLGRRLGAVRAPVEAGGGSTVRDYLGSLAALYRRAGGDPELRASAWRSLRRTLERLGGVAAGLSDEEAERRLALRSPAAATAFSRALAARRGAPGEPGLVALVQAASEAEAAFARTASEPLGRVR